MSKIIDNEEYLDTSEAMAELEASKNFFYKNVKPRLRVYHFSARKAPWYKKRDVLDIKEGKTVRKASIRIAGVFENWTLHLQSLGFQAETRDRFAPEITTLPTEAFELFHLTIPSDKPFVKRTKMSYADGQPICEWSTYYPLDLVEDLISGMKDGTIHGIPDIIKEKHGLVAGYGKDKEFSRITTFEELNLFNLLADEAVLILHRIACTEDRKVLLWYSDMNLLSSWFSLEHEYPIHHWAA